MHRVDFLVSTFLSGAPNLGSIVPEMGTSQPFESGLASALFTPVQQTVLGLIFGQPDRRFHSRELIRLVDRGTGAVHRQLKRLSAAELVTEVEEGNQKWYQANRESPIFAELHGLVVKTVGAVDPIRRSLEPLRDRIRVAFVFGSVAKGSDRSTSDIDLLVLGEDLEYAAVYGALEEAESSLARTVNPTVMKTEEWRERRRKNDPFVDRIVGQPKLFVIGDEDALG